MSLIIKEEPIDEEMKEANDEVGTKLVHAFDTTEENLIDYETFEKLKETLLCSVCADVYKGPMNVR